MSEWNYNDEIADVLARTLDEAASEKVIKKALNLGINFLIQPMDTQRVPVKNILVGH